MVSKFQNTERTSKVNSFSQGYDFKLSARKAKKQKSKKIKLKVTSSRAPHLKQILSSSSFFNNTELDDPQSPLAT